MEWHRRLDPRRAIAEMVIGVLQTATFMPFSICTVCRIGLCHENASRIPTLEADLRAHEEANLNSFGAVLGNEIAIKGQGRSKSRTM